MTDGASRQSCRSAPCCTIARNLPPAGVGWGWGGNNFCLSLVRAPAGCFHVGPARRRDKHPWPLVLAQRRGPVWPQLLGCAELGQGLGPSSGPPGAALSPDHRPPLKAWPFTFRFSCTFSPSRRASAFPLRAPASPAACIAWPPSFQPWGSRPTGGDPRLHGRKCSPRVLRGFTLMVMQVFLPPRIHISTRSSLHSFPLPTLT